MNELLPVAILAGGLGKRLHPLTQSAPKSLVEINGEPFIAHQLRLLAESGIRRVILCLGHLGEMVQEFAGDGSAFQISAAYSFDGEVLRGTGGAIRRALPLLGDAFFVLYGDSYLPCDYGAVQRAFEAGGRPALMTVFRNDGRWDTSNVELEGGEIRAYDKTGPAAAMRHIDYGLGVFSRTVFEAWPEEETFDLATVYRRLLDRGELSAVEVRERFYEIGSFEGLRDLEAYLRRRSGSFSDRFLHEAEEVLRALDTSAVERLASTIAETRDRGGRLFLLGVGGSAANASHAVNDFRKLCGIEAYAPTDNVSELTARTNDEGWGGVFEGWLRVSRLGREDMVLVLSVGGGDLERQVSPNLVAALELARERGCAIGGIVGRDGGHTARVASACVVVPTVNAAHVTPHTEAFQAVVWHLLVSHPKLKTAETKWESVR